MPEHPVAPEHPLPIWARVVIAMAAGIVEAAGNETDGLRELGIIFAGLQKVDPLAHDWGKWVLLQAGLRVP